MTQHNFGAACSRTRADFLSSITSSILVDYFIVFIKEINCCFILFLSIEVKKRNRNCLGKMPHLKKPRNASFLYVNRSSSCERERFILHFFFCYFRRCGFLWFNPKIVKVTILNRKVRKLKNSLNHEMQVICLKCFILKVPNVVAK